MTHWSSIPLENWMRSYYFDTPIDLGSSGVEIYNLSQVLELTQSSLSTLENLKLDDSLTEGSLLLRQALADRYLDGNPSKVFLTNGSNEGGFYLLQCLMEPGDQLIAQSPLYHTLSQLGQDLNYDVVDWPLQSKTGFQPDLDLLESLVTPECKMIAVNFPHNPTGISLTPAQLERLIGIAKSVDAYLVWDAAFEELVYEREPLSNPVNHYDKAITTGTLSKCFGAPGMRIGWVFADPKTLEKLIPLRDYLSLYVSPVLEHLAIPIMEKADHLISPRHARAQGNLALLRSWALERQNHIEWIEPHGGVTVFPKLKTVPDTEPFCQNLANEQGVMLVPGHCFGHRQHVRLGFGGPTANLIEGFKRLGTFLENYNS